MLRKLKFTLIALMLVFALGIIGCGEKNDTNSAYDVNKGEDKPVKIALLVNGNLGDKSFFDSANNGLELIKSEFGRAVETKVVEASYDRTKWEPAILDLSEQDWDIIVTGSFEMKEIVEKVAPEFPDKKYIVYDMQVDYDEADYSNVYSMLYKQNEASFLAGAVAAKTSKSNIISFLGAMDIPVTNDFLIGYIEGAKYVNPDTKVSISYVGDFSDAAKGKEMALAQYNMGADIGFAAAGQAGLGQFDASSSVGKYSIGVDSDQALIFEETDTEKAELVLTSVMKNIDQSLLRAMRLYMEGKLEFGKVESLGLSDDGVGIAKNKYYDQNVSEETKQLVEELTDKIVKGEIEVKTSFGMDTKEINEIRDTVKP